MTRPAGQYLGGGISLPIQPAQRLELVPFRWTVGRAPLRIVGDSARRVAVTVVPNGPCDLYVSDTPDTSRGQLIPTQGSTFNTSSELWAWSSGGTDYAADWGDFENATDTNGEVLTSPDFNYPTYLAGDTLGYINTYPGVANAATNVLQEQGVALGVTTSIASPAFPVTAGEVLTWGVRAKLLAATGNLQVYIYWGADPNFDGYQFTGNAIVAVASPAPAVWTDYTGTISVPNGVTYARIVCVQSNATAGSSVGFRRRSIRRLGGAPTNSHATHDTLNFLGDTEGRITLAKTSAGDKVAAGTQALKYDCDAGVVGGQQHTIILSSAVAISVDDEVAIDFDYRVTGSVTATFALTMIPATVGSVDTYPRRVVDTLNSSPVGSEPFRHATLIGRCSSSVSAVTDAFGDMEFNGPNAGTVWQPVVIITLAPYANAGTLIIDNVQIRPTRCVVTGQEHHA